MDPTHTGTTETTGTPRTGATGTTIRGRPGVATSGSDRPRLARHVRLAFSRTRQRQVLLHPETVVVLNDSGAGILALCDGRHTVDEIVAELSERYQSVPDDEVRQFLTRLVARRWVEIADG